MILLRAETFVHKVKTAFITHSGLRSEHDDSAKCSLGRGISVSSTLAWSIHETKQKLTKVHMLHVQNLDCSKVVWLNM